MKSNRFENKLPFCVSDVMFDLIEVNLKTYSKIQFLSCLLGKKNTNHKSKKKIKEKNEEKIECKIKKNCSLKIPLFEFFQYFL